MKIHKNKNDFIDSAAYLRSHNLWLWNERRSFSISDLFWPERIESNIARRARYTYAVLRMCAMLASGMMVSSAVVMTVVTVGHLADLFFFLSSSSSATFSGDSVILWVLRASRSENVARGLIDLIHRLWL